MNARMFLRSYDTTTWSASFFTLLKYCREHFQCDLRFALHSPLPDFCCDMKGIEGGYILFHSLVFLALTSIIFLVNTNPGGLPCVTEHSLEFTHPSRRVRLSKMCLKTCVGRSNALFMIPLIMLQVDVVDSPLHCVGLFLRTPLDRVRTSRRRRQHSHSVYILAYTALMNKPSCSNPASRNASAEDAAASAAALSAASALAPGTRGCARQLQSSVASAEVSAFSCSFVLEKACTCPFSYWGS